MATTNELLERILEAVGMRKNTTPSTATPVTADGTLDLATGQRAHVQNCGTAKIYVKVGSGASSSSFHAVLAAGYADDDGLGGLYEYGPVREPVTISYAFSATGTKRALVFSQ